MFLLAAIIFIKQNFPKFIRAFAAFGAKLQ
jgi:hypothetical protein